MAAFADILGARSLGNQGAALRAAGPVRAAVNRELCAFSARSTGGIPGLVDALYYAAECGPAHALVLREGGRHADIVGVADPGGVGPLVARLTRYADVWGDMLAGEAWPTVYGPGASPRLLLQGMEEAAAELRRCRRGGGA